MPEPGRPGSLPGLSWEGMRLLFAGVVLLALVLLTGVGCGDDFVRACRDACEKRDECVGDITDLARCKRACETPAALSEACLEANAAYLRCLHEQSCEDYLAARGCDAELQAVTALTCR